MDEARPGKRSVEHAIVLALALLGPAVLVLFATRVTPDPRGYGTHERLGLPPCLMMKWFHLPCPGCGVTTSVALAAHGRIRDAATNQPFGLVVVLAIPLVALWAVAGHIRGRDLYRDLSAQRIRPWAWWLGGALALSWAYKLVLVLGPSFRAG